VVAATLSRAMSVTYTLRARPNNPEDSHLHTSRRENLKYHKKLKMFDALRQQKVGRFPQLTLALNLQQRFSNTHHIITNKAVTDNPAETFNMAQSFPIRHFYIHTETRVRI
jgi:hypothetical protein